MLILFTFFLHQFLWFFTILLFSCASVGEDTQSRVRKFEDNTRARVLYFAILNGSRFSLCENKWKTLETKCYQTKLIEKILICLNPEWRHRQCVGLAYPRTRVRAPVAAASLSICSPYLQLAMIGAQGYRPVLGGGNSQSIGSTVSDPLVRSVVTLAVEFSQRLPLCVS